MTHHPDHKASYYLPDPSRWPIIASVALFCLLLGAANWLHGKNFGPYLFGLGLCILLYTICGWFGTVIRENRSGLLHSTQVDHSFRWSMAWFIFSEVMFFGAFFGVLLYTRVFAVPLLGGADSDTMTHLLLWPQFHSTWPLLTLPNPHAFQGPKDIMETWGIPAINTLLLLSSGATITVAHWALLKNKRAMMLGAQFVTILLGVSFLVMQANEYGIAYMEKGLKLSSGIFGTTFFMLTGFHALHVTIGTLLLIVMFYRMIRCDFNPHNHFAFEAAAWYWHFVDVVWLMLFIFVYWL